MFPARESLVSDIPAGDGKIVNLFYSVHCTLQYLVPVVLLRTPSHPKGKLSMTMGQVGFPAEQPGELTPLQAAASFRADPNPMPNPGGSDTSQSAYAASQRVFNGL